MPRPSTEAATPRRRPRLPTLVLIKEDLDDFLVQARALADMLERLRASDNGLGIEIQAGDRGSLYLPRIRVIL